MPAVFKYLLVHRCRIIYDAHEFFAGHQIFQKRPVRKSIWMLMERIAMPFVDTLLTISGPLADEYKKRYPRLKNVQVIRNLPSIKDKAPDVEKEYPRKDEPFTFLFHGYFHEGRALEQTLSAFQNLKDLQVRVILIGKGPLENRLKDLVHREKLDHFVKFVDFIPNNELINYIRHADTALVLIQADSVNRSYSLPNKFFESVMAGLPVLASNIPTLKKYIEKYELGLTVDPDDPYAISEAMRKIYFEQDKLNTWRKNCLAAADELNWENEAEKMKEIYLHIFD